MIKLLKFSSGNWYFEVAPELGANIATLRYDGKDVFVPLKSVEQLEVNPYIQGCPLLFPANRTANGKFVFENTEYTLPVNEKTNGANLHGNLHRQFFEVLSKKEEFIELQYVNNAQVYPFPFVINVIYDVFEGAFRQRYVIKNIGKKNLPLTFSLHTSFVEPEHFFVPIDKCQEKDDFNIPTGRYIELNDIERKIAMGSQSKNISISGYYKSCGNRAVVGDFEYIVSDNFDHWILFNANGKKNLLCVEPQSGKVNGLNYSDGCRVIAPDKSIKFETIIKKSI